MVPRAEKLSAVIAGKTVSGLAPAPAGGGTIISFADGCRMAVNGTGVGVAAGSTITGARQRGTEFYLDVESGPSSQIALKGPTSSVQVEDPDGNIVYAD